MYYRLGKAGHQVQVYIDTPQARDVFGGMINLVDDWRKALPWIREAGTEGIIIFESAGMGEIQDELRADGYQVIGGSAYGDRLEIDREFGQDAFRKMGLQTAASHSFTSYELAIAFIETHPARYVFKANGAAALRTRNYVGELDNGADVLALLKLHQKQWKSATPPDFVLMEHISGIEVGVGAYFNGEAFLLPACLDWEHKRLFPGSQGELTGEMGTVVTFRGAERIFDLTLARLQDALRQSGYCGYININLIANEDGLWPLEFTSRFGYPGFAICESLQLDSWPDIFTGLLNRQGRVLATREGFATGVVLTVPPFPYTHGYEELSKGAPVLFRDSMTPEDLEHLHMAEVATIGNQLVASGMTGYIAVANGIGDSVEESCTRAYALAGKVIAPNIRYRNDIGDRVINGDLAGLKALGYIA